MNDARYNPLFISAIFAAVAAIIFLAWLPSLTAENDGEKYVEDCMELVYGLDRANGYSTDPVKVRDHCLEEYNISL